MKGSKLITLIIASMAVGAVTACGPKAPKVQEYSILENWEGHPEEAYYAVSQGDAGELVIDYALVPGESAGWNYVGHSFAYDASAKETFSKYVKISLTVKLEKTSGSDEVLFKLQRASSTSAVREFRGHLTNEYQTFEFSIEEVDWNDVGSFYLFANRGAESTEAGTGRLTFSKFVLSTAEVDPQHNAIPDLNTVNFPEIWLDLPGGNDIGEGKCYQVSTSKHVHTIDYSKEASGWESILFGQYNLTETWFTATDYTRVVAKIKANVNVKVLFKAWDNNAGEHWIDLVANQEQVIDYNCGAIGDFSKSFVLFICAGDDAGATSGQVRIEGLRYVRENVNVFFADEEVRLTKPNTAGNYTFTQDEQTKAMTFAYEWTTVGYNNIEFLFSAFNTSKLNKVQLEINAQAATSMLSKPENNNAYESTVAIEAGVHSYEIELTAPIAAKWGNYILFFSFQSEDPVANSITINSFKLVK